MRFVAGRSAVAGLLAESTMEKRMAALWQRAIGKMLLAGPPLLHHREEIGKNLKSTRKPHTELLVDEGEEDSILFCNFGGKM